MKYVLVFLMAVIQTNVVYADQNDISRLSFPELDKQLIRLWLASHEKQADISQEAIKAINKEWKAASGILSSQSFPHINIQDFTRRVDDYVQSLKQCEADQNWSCLKSISYHLLYEFRSLRQCMFKTEYPIDLLWESYDAYSNVRKTVNDRMFDLREWFEFEDQVNDFICTWEYYDLRHINEIHEQFPGINKTMHKELKDDVKSCIVSLLESIETGFQSNFVLPCDELGEALRALLKMYSESKVIMLM